MESLVPVAALVAGITSHVAFFRVGEHHMYGNKCILASIAGFALSTTVQFHLFQLSANAAVLRTIVIASSYLGGLYSSIVIFRLFFHPLSRFPGPLGCKISSAWFATYLAGRDVFRQLVKLHQEHGNFVQFGSNDLSISHPKAVQAIYDLDSGCSKSNFYDLTRPMVSLQSTRDDAFHSRRRRIWSAAFGNKNLRDYDVRMAPCRGLLIKTIEGSGGLLMAGAGLRKYVNY
ncbi:putative cytochrome P450 [Rosellinia necatrix]|uniref:Putative cytochrome P450 n=1 Tax=Rosellinia necatrix TaxID=77044 RepID=A0A1S8A707_ROSNE|nr:putative cytochrome P450 [Rosellinia necatrix]